MALSLNLSFGWFRHPKAIQLIGILGKGAAELPLRLWCFCGEHHYEDGSLTRYSEDAIEGIVGWWGPKGAFIKAMVEVRLIDKREDGYYVHDWADHAGHIGAIMAKSRKMTALRLKKLREGEVALLSTSASDAGKPPDTTPLQVQHVEKLQETRQELPRQGSATHSITTHGSAGQGNGISPPAIADASLLRFDENKIVYQLTDDQFRVWRMRLAGVIHNENEGRPNNKFAWTGSGKGSEEDWFLLNNRMFTNVDKKKYMLECYNILDGKLLWCNCVEFGIMVAVRRSETSPVKNAMAFVMAALKNPAGMVSDVVEGCLRGYKLP